LGNSLSPRAGIVTAIFPWGPTILLEKVGADQSLGSEPLVLASNQIYGTAALPVIRVVRLKVEVFSTQSEIRVGRNSAHGSTRPQRAPNLILG